MLKTRRNRKRLRTSGDATTVNGRRVYVWCISGGRALVTDGNKDVWVPVDDLDLWTDEKPQWGGCIRMLPAFGAVLFATAASLPQHFVVLTGLSCVLVFVAVVLVVAKEERK